MGKKGNKNDESNTFPLYGIYTIWIKQAVFNKSEECQKQNFC